MNWNKHFKQIFLLSMAVCLTSCTKETKSNEPIAESSEKTLDTIIVKKKLEVNSSSQYNHASKAYTYYWLSDKDTLDFKVDVREYENDSTIHLSVSHKNPILFSVVLKKIKQSFPVIKEDYKLSNLSSLYFREPIYYLDLATELSDTYEKQFGQKNIEHAKLNTFLLHSTLNKQLENLVNPLGKSVKHYGIEKFHLIEKTYFDHYIPNQDLSAYPEFSLNGMGISVRLEAKSE